MVKATKGKNRAARSLVASIDEAADLLEQGDVDGAINLFEFVLSQDSSSARALDGLGEAYAAAGRPEDAKKALDKSIALEPSGGSAKHLLRGQLSEGVEAAQHFGNAINLLQGMLAECLASVRMGTTAVSSERERALRRELSGACCSMAELYMTDLCDEDRAEEEATKFAAEAIAADESNPEGYAVGADLRLCQCRKDEAVGLLNQCAIMLRACYAAVDGEGRPKHEEEEEEDEGLDEDEEEGEEEIALEGGAAGAMEEEPQGISGAPSTLQPELPPWHARLHFAQTCMEVGELGLYGHAAETLERLIEEDDSAMEAWFLLGEAFLLGGKAEEAVDVLEEAEDILTGALMAAGVKVKAMPDAGTLASHSGAIASLAEEGREELKEKRKRMRELADAAKEKLGRE